MNEDILKQLENHESRISALEKQQVQNINITGVNQKQKTLREIVKGRKFKNGQEQIAVVVGYYEKIIGKLINKGDIEREWNDAKMVRKYNPNFLKRAKDDSIRIHEDDICDLTQTGEEFLEKFMAGAPQTNTPND